MSDNTSTDSSAGTSRPVSGGSGSDQQTAFDLLVEAVEALQLSGKVPTGSEVRLALKNRTYDGFDPKKLGFRKFRDFLDEASKRGLVEVDVTRPGDVAVRLSARAHSEPARPRPVRGDLWRAFLDWAPDELRLYDIHRDAVVRLPREPAPLEPDKFAEVRRQLAEDPQSLVSIPRITQRQQLSWMHEFSQSRTPDVRPLLEEALNGEKPVKSFAQMMRALPDEHAQWTTALVGHVRACIGHWQSEHMLTFSIDKAGFAGTASDRNGEAAQDAAGDEASTRVDEHAAQDATVAALSSLIRSQRPTGGHQRDHSRRDESREIRERLHAAIDRMPIEELRRVSIPVGYLFQD